MTRGLAMHESLLKNCPNFHLYIFAFDKIAVQILSDLNLQHVTVISLHDFEDEELLRIKSTRTATEYCWTCTPSTILYCIKKYKLANCTYIDADMIFYGNPQVLIDEMGDNSVIITDHRYTPEYNLTVTSGKYCVQFMFFKNDERGMLVLNWWRDACIEWCYNRIEDGKFGDQKYLDDWTTRFEGVHELQHIGGGVAAWNVQQYDFTNRNGKLYLKEKEGVEKELVFYHFHALKFYNNDVVCLSPSFFISKEVATLIYFPYIRELIKQAESVKKIYKQFDANAGLPKSPRLPYTWKDKVHLYKQAFLSLSRYKVRMTHKEINTHHYFMVSQIMQDGTPDRS
jgi:hypothetical protein